MAALLASQSHPRLLRPLFRLKSGPYRYDKQQWEDEFSAGGWDFLTSPLERHRNTLLAGCVDQYAPDGLVLEIGCGTGALQSSLLRNGHRAYLGIDISEAALARAKKNTDGRSTFLAAPAETFEPPGSYDAIVFAETLYYLADPAAQLVRYSRYLNPDGHLFVSMALTGLRDGFWKLSIWQDLRSHFKTANEIDLFFPGSSTCPAAVAWTLKVLKPKNG
ncbi:MAG: class I SAM-dependent methyltransferase [Acetobacteraceae bacterium]|nr:class I SAM-dependent methyltransferase [Acetobacteraceae bacterium]